MTEATMIGQIELLDFHPRPDDLRADVLSGLTKPDKTLPCKLFYDQRGSRLFDQICQLPEYYPTRTEMRIMRDNMGEISRAVGPHALLVEYGSGSSLKTRLLLSHLKDLVGYVPIDISRDHLLAAARALTERFDDLLIRPVCADYTNGFALPRFDDRDVRRVVAYFPGSTIGNFEPDEALAFLRRIRKTCGQGSALLIGVDLKKDPAILHAAYNDSAGVTAAFNRNILTHINRELAADFDPQAFAHYAPFNPRYGRMEMHLVSQRAHTIGIGDDVIEFAEGESIHTESCYKYTLDAFDELARQAGYRVSQRWLDERRQFSVTLMSAA